MCEPSIETAKNRQNQKNVYASEVFKNPKVGFANWKRFIEDKCTFECLECDQQLFIQRSKNDRLFFTHGSHSNDCLLKKSDLTIDESREINQIIKLKESPRHKYLKNKIGSLAKITNGVDPKSIFIDDHFIIEGNNRRKPDIFFTYKGQQMVFEIQLSPLPLKYIMDRYHFYKQNNIYLVWILDSFDVHGQSSTEKDLKRLYTHQNFFRLDEFTNNELQLKCEYKKVFIKNDETRTNWTRKNIKLHELKFNKNLMEAYYYNLEKATVNFEQKLIQVAKQKERQKKLSEVENIVIHLRNLYGNDKTHDKHLSSKLIYFDDWQLNILNKKLNLYSKKIDNVPFLHSLLTDHFNFFLYLLECHQIEKNIQALNKEGQSLLQMLISTFDKQPITMEKSIKHLFKAGYRLTDNDQLFLAKELPKDLNYEQLALRINFYNKLKQRAYEIDKLLEIESVLYTLESIKHSRIVGFRISNFIALCNNSLEYHGDFWIYIQNALKAYELQEKVMDSDKKGSFKKKLDLHQKDKHLEYNYRYHLMIELIFPEITKYIQPVTPF